MMGLFRLCQRKRDLKVYNMDKIRLNEDVNMIVCHSIEIDGCHSIKISDDTMLSIANHFTGIQSISIKD
jgi:hypothetical protein